MIDKQTKFFPTYLISLKKDHLRRQKLEEMFPRNFQKFITIDAIYGGDINANNYYKQIIPFFHKYKKIMSPAELGCTLSHVKALNFFLETTASHALVIEDDVIGSDDDIFFINHTVRTHLKNGIAFCGCQDGLLTRYKYGKIIEEGVMEISNANRMEFSRTAAYVVSRDAAKCILNFHCNKYITVADYWSSILEEFHGSILYIHGLSHPTDLTNSHIEADRAEERRSFFKKLFSQDFFEFALLRLTKETKRLWFRLCGHAEIKLPKQ